MGKGAGAWVLSKLWGIALILAVCVAFFGAPFTASLATNAFTWLGQGIGVTAGSMPELAQGVRDGQAATGGTSTTTNGGGSNTAARN